VTAAVAGTGTVVGMPAASAATVDDSAWYILVNRHSGKALDVYDLATDDGAPMVQWARNDGAWQQWQFVDSGGGFYRLRSRHSGKVLDVRDLSTTDGADIVQWSDQNGLNQQFQLADSAAGHVRLINRNSGKALEVFEWSTADGARITQWSDHGGANQQWQLVQVGVGQQPPPSYPNPGAVSGDIGVHDPTVAKTPAGGYLLANTGNNVALKTSTDRTNWQNAGSAFPGGVPWAHPYTNGSNHVWAPDLSYENGRYYMYYSASTFGSNRSAIFLATSTTGAAGSWTNQGLVIDSQTSGNFNAIDPNLIIDDQGNWWLSFGSFWSGIKMIQLNPNTGLRTGSAFHSIAGRNGGAIEAPTIHRRGQYYYLYVSFDLCCRGADSTYRVMVGRSTSVTGPYVDRNGTPMNNGGGTEILAGHGSINGPGHQEVINDNGQDVLFYHYYANNGTSLLGINLLGYDAADWPFVF
jgi:arabinan endo-1,5-alpha-L-arabinosidase